MNRRSGNKNNSNRRNKAEQIYDLTTKFTPKSQVTVLRLNGGVRKYTTTVTTGVIAVFTDLDPSTLIPDFATRFACFDEYRCIEIKVSAYPCSSTNPGSVCHWFEPVVQGGSPTSADAQRNNVTQFSAGANNYKSVIVYKPTDFQYLDWKPTSAGTEAIGSYCVYTNNADFAAPTAVTDLFVTRFEFQIQFRGVE